MITVHGRTRQQFYKGSARWNLVRAVVDAVEVPVVVNGDIADAGAAREALRQSGAAAVMIGRGAQGRPWIVGQIGAELEGRAVEPAPSSVALASHVREHYEDVLSTYGTHVGVRVARKHLGWYLEAAGIEPGKGERHRMLNSEDPAEVGAMIDYVYGSDLRLAA